MLPSRSRRAVDQGPTGAADPSVVALGVKDGELLDSSAAELLAFVVGAGPTERRVDFRLTVVDGSPNIQADGALPPLNRNGLRRLARHLEALADLLEYGKPQRVTRLGRLPEP